MEPIKTYEVFLQPKEMPFIHLTIRANDEDEATRLAFSCFEYPDKMEITSVKEISELEALPAASQAIN